MPNSTNGSSEMSRVAELARKGRKLGRLLREPSYRRPLLAGVAATVEHESVPFPADYATVIDVGAGRGQFAVFALKRFPRARVHSFEPLPSSYRTAVRAIGKSERAEVRQLAIGAKTGNQDIFISADADSSSLLRPTDEQTERFPGTGEVDRVEVDVMALDEAVTVVDARPALLKLDLQGGELDALRGAEQTLGSVDAIFVECSFVELYEGQPLADELICYLKDRSFALRGVFSPNYGADGTCVQADLLFQAAARE